MSYTSRVYRQRNAHTHQQENNQEQAAFFGKAEHQSTQGKSPKPFFQAKLTVNQPGDVYEQEADSMANAVVNHQGGTPAVQQKEISSIQRLATSEPEEQLGTDEERMKRDKEIQTKPAIQRMCPECEKEQEPDMQRMEMPGKEEEEKKEAPVQTKPEGGHSASPALSSRVEQSAGKGKALPRQTQAEMGSSFGADFTGVRVHTDAESVNMNKQLHAQAFTHGRDIYFNAGKYNTDTTAGKHLLAHELTHVIQQGGVQRKKIQTKPIQKVNGNYFPVKGPIPHNTVHCLKRWTPCRAPNSPGSWAARVSYHCPRLILPGIIVPGTTQFSYVTIPDEFIGTSPTGKRQYRCRRKPKTMTFLTAADAAATGINLTRLYLGQQSCHDGYRSILRTLLRGLFAPSGGGPSGIRVNASVPVGGFPC